MKIERSIENRELHGVKYTYRLPSFEGQRLLEETSTSTLNEKQYEGKEETWKRVGYKFPGLPALTKKLI